MAEIASILKDSEHLSAIVESAEAVLEGVDLSALLVYLIETTSAEALPYLAEQFGVLGYGGFILAETEEQQRALLKKGLELQRHKGTPWAIKEALKALDYGEPEIVEPSASGYALTYDGSWRYDGSITYVGSARYSWATFDIVFDLGESRGITDAATQTAIKIVEAYKNARSRLVGVTFKATLSDTLQINDDGLAYDRIAPPISETPRGFIYDGSTSFNGSKTYEGTVADTTALTVRNSSGTIILTDTI